MGRDGATRWFKGGDVQGREEGYGVVGGRQQVKQEQGVRVGRRRWHVGERMESRQVLISMMTWTLSMYIVDCSIPNKG